ncbi:MAG: hypothetical protein IPP03_18015 [Dechloromonas sp.]|nr:hypothetical protein [Candidatus Dechloromonas phosphoritropha]
MLKKMTHRLSAALDALTMLLFGTSAVAEDGDIAWQHRIRQDVATLTANPLGTASCTAFNIGRRFAEARSAPMRGPVGSPSACRMAASTH